MPSSTAPLVDPDDAAARAAELADAVAHAFAENAGDPSLSRGSVGAAWLLAETGEARHRDIARRLLASAATQYAARAPSFALFAGSTGLQWTLDALSRVLYDEPPDAEVDLDRVLAEALRADRAQHWQGHHDLVSGLVGIGVYALANPRAGRRAALCGAIVDQLERTALRPAPDQATWITEPSLLADDARERFPRGRIDLGLAHGVPGVAAWLAEVALHPELPGDLHERAARLLDAAIAWLLARSEANDHPHGYPYFVEPDGQPVPTPRVRLAWCYGDLGVAWALTRSATARGRADWAEAAQSAGARAAARDMFASGVSDPWLCHGAAGVAHVFGCLHRETGSTIYADAARRWWQRALELADEKTVRTAPALLEGAAGLGLALFATLRDARPRWNAMLLL